MRVLPATLVFLAFSGACTRDPVEAVCPSIPEGALVITEIRGPQSPADNDGPWVELYNASASTIDLAGIEVRFRHKDGSGEIPILVRRTQTVAAGEYVVLGLFLDDDPNKPTFVDYGFADDFAASGTSSWLPAAAIQVDSCGERIDAMQYDVLPKTGTYSLGVMPPNDTDNDLSASWCTDSTPAGTPRAANNACPPPT